MLRCTNAWQLFGPQPREEVASPLCTFDGWPMESLVSWLRACLSCLQLKE